MIKLNPKQEKFCQEYAKGDKPAYEAYMAAGYAAVGESARANVSKLLTKPNIIARLKELGKQAEGTAIMTIQQRRELLTKIAEKAAADGDNRDYKAAIKAIDTLNKMDAAYVTRQEVDVRGAMPVVLVDDVDG